MHSRWKGVEAGYLTEGKEGGGRIPIRGKKKRQEYVAGKGKDM
jgi:hypothetical protein